MSEKYVNLIKKSSKRKRQMRLIIKNGIQYVISLTTDKKPKFKKPKFINQKKWIIKDVLLHSFKIIDKAEIHEIIVKDSKQQESYDKCFAMNVDALYNLMLSDRQFKALARYLDTKDVDIGTKIAMTRKGSGFKTHINFFTSLTNKEK